MKKKKEKTRQHTHTHTHVQKRNKCRGWKMKIKEIIANLSIMAFIELAMYFASCNYISKSSMIVWYNLSICVVVAFFFVLTRIHLELNHCSTLNFQKENFFFSLLLLLLFCIAIITTIRESFSFTYYCCFHRLVCCYYYFFFFDLFQFNLKSRYVLHSSSIHSGVK